MSTPRARWLAAEGWRSGALLLAAYALLLCARMPQIIIKGRFWAEEGHVFFSNAWTLPPLQALLTSFGGYLNLPANAATLAARWLLPLEWAPYLTISVALAIHLLAPLLLLSASDSWLRPWWMRAGCLLLLLLAPGVDEGLLQTLHCQFQTTLCCALIVALDVAPGWRHRLRLGLLAFAPLCGVVPIVLIPIFLFRAWTDRSRLRLTQAAALGAGSAIQLLGFFHAVAGRGYALHAVLALCAVTVRYLESPFLGLDHADALATLIKLRLSEGHVPWLVVMLPCVAFPALLLLTVRTRSSRPAFWLLTSGVAIAAATYIGAIGGAWPMIDGRSGERYVFVPQTLFALTVLALAATRTGWTRAVSYAAVAWMLCVGVNGYLHPWNTIANGPSWRPEVAIWRADPSHVLQLWPAGWSMTLGRSR